MNEFKIYPDLNGTHKFEIFVNGGSYLPSMCNHFPGTDIGFAYDNEQGYQFFGYSYHIDELNDINHVAIRLYSLQLLLNGAMNATAGFYSPNKIVFSGFADFKSRQIFSINVSEIEEMPFSLNPQIEKFGFRKPKSDFTAWLLNRAKLDEELRALLFLLGIVATNTTIEKILTWGTLYKIMDTVRHLCKQNGLRFDNFASSTEIERFTLACNKTAFLGIYSRHGSSAAPVTRKVPMTDIGEAIELIFFMSKNFIVEYMKMKHAS